MFGAVILHWQMESDYMVWKIFGNTLFKGKSSKLQNIQHQNFIKDWEPSDKRQSIWHSSSNKTARPHLVFWCLFFLTQYIRNYSYSSVIFLWSPKSFIIVLTHPHLVVFKYHTVTSFITFFALILSGAFSTTTTYYSTAFLMNTCTKPLTHYWTFLFWSLAIRKTPYWPPPYLSFHITNALGNACKGICLVMYNKESERCVLRYFYFERMKLC